MYNFKATTVVKFISIGLGVFEIYYETKGVFFSGHGAFVK